MVYNCKYDFIESTQTDHSSPFRVIEGVAGESSSQIDVDITGYFKHNASDYCTLQNYKIARVYNYAFKVDYLEEEY